jgi:hypothetical protein
LALCNGWANDFAKISLFCWPSENKIEHLGPERPFD